MLRLGLCEGRGADATRRRAVHVHLGQTGFLLDHRHGGLEVLDAACDIRIVAGAARLAVAVVVHSAGLPPCLAAQFSGLQTPAPPAAAGVAPSACARLDTRLAPRPAPAVIRTVRRATPSSPSFMSLLPVAASTVQVQACLVS